MRVIGVTNQKGGSGKTTTAVNLAAALGKLDQKVLLIDLDPQGPSTSMWFGLSTEDEAIFAVLTGETDLADIVCDVEAENVRVAPASSWLVGLEKALASEIGTETILKRRVEQLNEDEYEYVLFDCPPSLGLLTVNAFCAAQELLVPVETHVLALDGLVQLLRTYDLVKDRLNAGLDLGGILPCRVDNRTRHAAEVVASLRERFGDTVFRTVIRENVRLAEAPSFRQPITDYAPSSTGASDYLSLAKELVERGARS